MIWRNYRAQVDRKLRGKCHVTLEDVGEIDEGELIPALGQLDNVVVLTRNETRTVGPLNWPDASRQTPLALSACLDLGTDTGSRE